MTAREKFALAVRYRRDWCRWLAVPRRYRNRANCETFRQLYRSARASWYRAHRWEIVQVAE